MKHLKEIFFFIGLIASFSVLQTPAFAQKNACSKSYRPVCSTKGKNFANSCLAKKAQTQVKCQGHCPCNKPNTCRKVACPRARTCKVIQGKARCVCSPIRCRTFCKFGYVKVNGCPTCQCK